MGCQRQVGPNVACMYDQANQGIVYVNVFYDRILMRK